MKTIKIFIIIILIFSFVFYLFNKTNFSIKTSNHKKNIEYLTLENYTLIRESPYADKLSKYTIKRKENEIRFVKKDSDYTLFFLSLNPHNKKVKLTGLDGYGIRDKEFLKYIRNLIDKIKQETLNEKQQK